MRDLTDEELMDISVNRHGAVTIIGEISEEVIEPQSKIKRWFKRLFKEEEKLW